MDEILRTWDARMNSSGHCINHVEENSTCSIEYKSSQQGGLVAISKEVEVVQKYNNLVGSLQTQRI